MSEQDLAIAWLRGLAARGVSVTLRGMRLQIKPRDAYKSLTDDEVLTLRHHREAIKAAVGTHALDAGPRREPPQATAVVPAPELTRVECAFINPDGRRCALDPNPDSSFCKWHVHSGASADERLKRDNFAAWLEISDSAEAAELRQARADVTMLRMMFKTSPYL